MSKFFGAAAVAAGLFFSSLGSLAAHAASISYGNFGPVPPGVMFLNVTESSGTDAVPLYGGPSPFSVGLNFTPMTFGASTVNGGADLTDGQLNFSVMGPGVNSISLLEGGDYTLTGVGTSATQVFGGASLRVTVMEINGVNVAPILLSPTNASVGFNLTANPGAVQPWSTWLSTTNW
jgi:hypothetical protein